MYRSKICRISTFGLFDLITLNMCQCHMWRTPHWDKFHQVSSRSTLPFLTSTLSQPLSDSATPIFYQVWSCGYFGDVWAFISILAIFAPLFPNFRPKFWHSVTNCSSILLDTTYFAVSFWLCNMSLVVLGLNATMNDSTHSHTRLGG